MQQLGLFDQLKGKTQAEKVLWWLENHGRITNMQCHEIFGIRHAPSVIRDIRKQLAEQGGKFEIINEHQKGCNRFGETCYWDDYVLVRKDVTKTA